FDFERPDLFQDLGCSLLAFEFVIPSGAKRSRGSPSCQSDFHFTAHISEIKSRHSGLARAMSASFYYVASASTVSRAQLHFSDRERLRNGLVYRRCIAARSGCGDWRRARTGGAPNRL